MTGPVTTEALVEGLASEIADILLDGGALSPKDFAQRLVAGPALQQVTAERDEARERVARLEADIRAAVVEVGNQARARGEAEGALRISEAAGIVDGWRERAASAEAFLATATSELARLRAEGEAKNRVLKVFADAAAGIPASVSDTAPAARVTNDARHPASITTIPALAFRAARAATAREGQSHALDR